MPVSSTPSVDSIEEPTPPKGLDQAEAISGRAGTDRTASAAAVQAERRRIAQALHDTVSQTLTGTYLQAIVTARKLEASDSEGVDDVTRLTEMIHRAVVELTDVIRQLQPENEATTQ